MRRRDALIFRSQSISTTWARRPSMGLVNRPHGLSLGLNADRRGNVSVSAKTKSHEALLEFVCDFMRRCKPDFQYEPCFCELELGGSPSTCSTNIPTAIARLLPYSTDVLMLPAIDTEGGVITMSGCGHQFQLLLDRHCLTTYAHCPLMVHLAVVRYAVKIFKLMRICYLFRI